MRSLTLRLLGTFLILISLSLGGLVWRVGTLLDASRFAETQRDQEGRAILVASASEEFLEKYLTNQIDVAALRAETVALGKEVGQRLLLLNARSLPIADSMELPLGAEESKKPEVANAMQGRVAMDIRLLSNEIGETLFTAAPIYHDKDLIGIARLELPMSAVRASSEQMWLMLIGTAVVAAGATILVSLIFARSLTSPIRELTSGAVALAEGDLRTRIRIKAAKELEQLARAFNFMADRISRVMEDQRAFVADAAHELRTPLTTIRLRAEALREGAKDNPQVAEKFLGDIETETDRLSRMVDQLLDLSRIETGLIEPRREPVAMQTIAKGVVEQLTPRAREQGVILQMDMRDDLPNVNADPDQLRQVFTNLIGNAIKFTPSGGSVQVSTRLDAQRKELWTSVRDSGIGIGAAELPHIFDRFYRSDKARARQTGGAGLGLAIVKSILDAHGGRVWAESELGKGTQITFALRQ